MPISVEDDEDPVVAEYDVYITPESQDLVYLLQYPSRSRDKPYDEDAGLAPTEMRIKPKTGFLEMDIPVPVSATFDRRKGIEFGEAQKRAKQSKVGGFGLSAGFSASSRSGIVRPQTGAQGEGEPQEEAVDHHLKAFDRAVDEGQVLVKNTLGGQIVKARPDEPVYMLGAFKDSKHSSVTNIEHY